MLRVNYKTGVRDMGIIFLCTFLYFNMSQWKAKDTFALL